MPITLTFHVWNYSISVTEKAETVTRSSDGFLAFS